MSMTVLFIKKLLGLLFPVDENKTFLTPFMTEKGKYIKFSDENYTVEARIKVIKNEPS